LDVAVLGPKRIMLDAHEGKSLHYLATEHPMCGRLLSVEQFAFCQ